MFTYNKNINGGIVNINSSLFVSFSKIIVTNDSESAFKKLEDNEGLMGIQFPYRDGNTPSHRYS